MTVQRFDPRKIPQGYGTQAQQLAGQSFPIGQYGLQAQQLAGLLGQQQIPRPIMTQPQYQPALQMGGGFGGLLGGGNGRLRYRMR